MQLVLFRNGDPLLTHILQKVEGDCNSEGIEVGDYQTGDSTITFYSYWARAGDAPVSPFGVRKQVYKVALDGRIRLVQSTLYIETSRPGWRENKGIEYLFQPPKNAAQKVALADYQAEVEAEYKGRFVSGKEKDGLFKEVRQKLKKQIHATTGDWHKTYADKLGGYKR